MSTNRCPFCDHANVPDAAFCSECGAQIDLAPCPSCSAVNKVTASVCYQCHAPLPKREAPVAAVVAPAPPPVSGPRRVIDKVAGAAAIVMIVTIAYFASRGSTTVTAPAAGRPEPATSASGPITASVPPPVAPAAKDAKPVAEPAPAPVPVARIARPSRSPAPAAEPVAKAAGPSATAEPAAEPAAKAPRLALPLAPPPREAPRPVACTEAVAALGLCTPGNQPGR